MIRITLEQSYSEHPVKFQFIELTWSLLLLNGNDKFNSLSFIHMSNYCSNAVRVIDRKWWIKWPDDSQCQNQSVNMPPWGDRDTSIFSWYLIYLPIAEHLIPPGKCVHLLWSNGQDPLLNANDSQTDKCPWSEPVSVGFLFESWYFWKPKRGASTDLYLSPSASPNTLLCDCFRFNIKRKKKSI